MRILVTYKKSGIRYFQKFHAMVERGTGNLLKRLQTYNGGEYISKEFKEYYSKHGIGHEKTIPSTPRHSGDVNHSILIRSWKSDVCYGVYTSRYISCNWSCKQVPSKLWWPMPPYLTRPGGRTRTQGCNPHFFFLNHFN